MPNSSEITTTPKDQGFAIGTQLGERGLAMPANSTPQDRNDALAMAVQQLRHSLLSPLVTEQSRNELAAQADRLSVPAPGDWLAARVASLLSPYYEKETPQGVRMMEAEDWIASLSGSPRWAVDAAVRWWKGPENDKRHRRPMEGDIAARVIVEMDAVRAAKIKIGAFDSGVKLSKPQEPDRPQISEEERQRAQDYAASFISGRFPTSRNRSAGIDGGDA